MADREIEAESENCGGKPLKGMEISESIEETQTSRRRVRRRSHGAFRQQQQHSAQRRCGGQKPIAKSGQRLRGREAALLAEKQSSGERVRGSARVEKTKIW